MINLPEKMIAGEIKKLVPVLGKQNADRLYRAYLLADEDTKIRLIELLDVIKAAVLSNPELRDTILMEAPSQASATAGDIEIGKVLYGRKELYPIRMTEKSFLTHIGIFGSSGYGKTNISYWLISQLAERNIPVLIFDFSKRNYKDLLNSPMRDKVDIYTVGRDVAPLRFNPLKPPPGVLDSQWMKEFATIFDHAYWLLGGGRHIILKALSDVFEQTKNPRMSDLKEWVYSYKGGDVNSSRERNWLATAERPLESLSFKEIGEIFETDAGVTPSDFFKPGRITVLELDALDTGDKTFLIEIILQWLRDWLLVGTSREKLIGCIILEEAHHILNRDKSIKIGSETVIDLVFREIRELGLGVIYLDQHPSLVSYPALGNTSTQIYMNLGLDTKHTSDILDASNMLGLDYDEQGNYLRRLPVGQGFMLMRMMSFTEPFLVKFNYVDLKKGSITDADIDAHMRPRHPEIFEGVAKKPTRKDVERKAFDEVAQADITRSAFKVNDTTARGWEEKQPLVQPVAPENPLYEKIKEQVQTAPPDVEAKPWESPADEKSSSKPWERPADKSIGEEKKEWTSQFHASPEPTVEEKQQAQEAKEAQEDADKYGARIIDSLGNGAGAFASEIYKKISMSGSVFNEKIQNLMDQQLVGLRTAKIQRNRLYYYYLTDRGLAAFKQQGHEALPPVEEMNIARIMEIFTVNGWKTKQEGSRLYLEGDGQRLVVRLLGTAVREEISREVRGFGSFLVPNEAVKNILLQEVAKFSAEQQKEVTVFVQIASRFEVKGGFEKVKFEAELPKE